MSRTRIAVLVGSVLLLVLAAVPAHAQGGTAVARLRAFEEVPALSTGGGGHFTATISADGSTITYELSYFNLRGAITQSHLHLAQRGVNGGIMIFLCSNLGNGPAGTQSCPTGNGTITGTIHASDVIGGAVAQGLTPGDLAAVLRGIRAGVVYANVHTSAFPGGEIRGQLLFTPAP
ncbi:MAG: CHRD domain-containing protein [Thermoanaerobaculia bacterium]